MKKDLSVGESVFVGGVVSLGIPVVFGFISIAFLPLTVYGAWCDMHVWNWFASPYLHLPAMPLVVAIGIGFWIRLQTFSSKVVEGEKTKFWMGVLTSITFHTSSLAMAYLVHRFWRF